MKRKRLKLPVVVKVYYLHDINTDEVLYIGYSKNPVKRKVVFESKYDIETVLRIGQRFTNPEAAYACREKMIERYHPSYTIKERENSSKVLRNTIPHKDRKHVVFMLTTSDKSEVVYIGRTSNLPKIILEEYIKQGRIPSDSVLFSYQQCDSLKHAFKVKKALVKKYQPPLNWEISKKLKKEIENALN